VISLEAVAYSSYCNTAEWFWWDWSLSQWPTGFLLCFDTVGWIMWPVKIVREMTYKESSGTLSLYSSSSHDLRKLRDRPSVLKYSLYDADRCGALGLWAGDAPTVTRNAYVNDASSTTTGVIVVIEEPAASRISDGTSSHHAANAVFPAERWWAVIECVNSVFLCGRRNCRDRVMHPVCPYVSPSRVCLYSLTQKLKGFKTSSRNARLRPTGML